MTSARMFQRRGSAAQWAAVNPVLGSAEIGVVSDDDSFKIGDGITAWNDLAFSSVSLSAVEAIIEDAAVAQLAGVEMGYAQTVLGHSTSNVYDITGTALIPGLSVSVVGGGRPVDIEFFAATLYNTTLYADVIPFILINNGAAAEIATTVTSLFTDKGPSSLIKRRTVLADGQNFTIAAGMFCGATAGTATLPANTYAPSYLSVVSR